MKRINPVLLETYLQTDPVSRLAESAQPGAMMTSQRWLEETPAKRFIYYELYADCLSPGGTASLLDVGGGLTALTPLLAKGRRYGLIDPLFHETPEGIAAMRQAAGEFEHLDSDWHGVRTGDWDLIVANDLFPNVDQRLALFLEWALPKAREVRLSLTFHNTPRWFTLQRAGLEERLTMLAFDGVRTLAALEPFAARIAGWQPQLFSGNDGSVFANGRQIVTLSVQGDR